MPYEDWTTYTKVGDILLDVTANRLTLWMDNVDRWVSDDKGVSFFAQRFEHKIDFRITNAVMPAGTRIGIWAVTNTIEDLKFLVDNLSQACSLEISRGSAAGFQVVTLINHETGASDVSIDHATAVYWYATITRSPTTLQVELFAEVARTTLQDTIIIPLNADRKYQFVMNAISAADSLGALVGVLEDLDLGLGIGDHAFDIKHIVSSIFKHIEGGFSGNIHWPGTEGADDASWIEPWVSIKLIQGRANDWLYQVSITVNVFAKESDNTYVLLELAGEVMKLLKAINIIVKNYDHPTPVMKGCVSLKEPESIDMGERQERSGGTAGRSGLRQITVRCDGSAYPVAP